MLKDSCNQYLTVKRHLLDSGEIVQRTFWEYHRACELTVTQFGKTRLVCDLTANDFGNLRASLAKTRGALALGNEIQRVRMIFRFGHDQGIIENPIRFGQSFNKPSKKVVRKARSEAGLKMFKSVEINQILEAIEENPTLKAITLLAINCGFGQTDIANLPESAIDLKSGFVTFPRLKTGIERRAKLWNETVEAIREAIAIRPKTKDPACEGLAFLMKNGNAWIRYSESNDPSKWSGRQDRIGRNFSKILKDLNINGRRGFYALRHSFQTAAEACRDFPAIMYCMGHADASMSGNYRERIEDDRLIAVAETVHAWLFDKSVQG